MGGGLERTQLLLEDVKHHKKKENLYVLDCHKHTEAIPAVCDDELRPWTPNLYGTSDVEATAKTNHKM